MVRSLPLEGEMSNGEIDRKNDVWGAESCIP